MFIDNHCHINSLSKRDFLKTAEIKNFLFVDVSIDYETSLLSLEISSQNSFVYSCLGFHPSKGKFFKKEILNSYERFIQDNREKVIGIGEIGLDYKAEIDSHSQIEILSSFIDLAKRFNLPLMIHNRWRSDLILDILDSYFTSYNRIIFHCFSQDISFLEKVLKKDGWISFSLSLLKRKSLEEILKNVPLENLLLETDSPYIFWEGRPSSPLDIKKIYEFVSSQKNINMERLTSQICYNFKKIYQRDV